MISVDSPEHNAKTVKDRQEKKKRNRIIAAAANAGRERRCESLPFFKSDQLR
jgi:hypothetical protein